MCFPKILGGQVMPPTPFVSTGPVLVHTGFACIAGPQPNNSRCLRLITTECARDHKGDCFGKQSDTELICSTLDKTDSARSYLQPHYGNGVFGNVYLSAGQH